MQLYQAYYKKDEMKMTLTLSEDSHFQRYIHIKTPCCILIFKCAVLSVYSMKYRLSLLENLFEVVSFDIVTDELPQITQCMGNTGHCYTLTGRNLSDNTNKRVHTLHTQAAAHQCLRVHWPRAMTSWRLLSDSHTHLMRKVNMHVIISPEV